MTRLKTEWIDHMPDGMEEYNRMLKERTGLDLSGLVMQAYGMTGGGSPGCEPPRAGSRGNGIPGGGFPGKGIDCLRKTVRVSAVPITQGLGIIGSFSESVASIVRSMGFRAEVSQATDVEGIFRAKEAGAQVIFLADDERFIALNTENGRVGENDRCTALGYIEAARAMAAKRGKDLGDMRVLQIGYGRVGRIAVELLTDRGISFDLYDKEPEKIAAFRETRSCLCNRVREVEGRAGKALSKMDIRGLDDLQHFLGYDVILDFTNEGSWIKEDMIREDALYLSPGVPLSLTPAAARLLQDNSLYDQLEVGTAMMLGEALARP